MLKHSIENTFHKSNGSFITDRFYFSFFLLSFMDGPCWSDKDSHPTPLATIPIFLKFLKETYSVKASGFWARGRLDLPFLRRLEMYHMPNKILNFFSQRVNSNRHVVMSHDCTHMVKSTVNAVRTSWSRDLWLGSHTNPPLVVWFFKGISLEGRCLLHADSVCFFFWGK